MSDVDYLIVGAGAMGMAFADTILSESDATVALVDRRPRPGGHWNDAYPHVRLHQPSAFYGVNSRQLGTNDIDVAGWNEGLSELASGTEVVAYFDQVLRQQFLPTGRARFYPMSQYEGDGTFQSLVTGERTTVSARKVVNAAYMNVTVPSVRPPQYDVADGVTCVPPNDLGKPDVLPSDAVVVIGGGKTAMDAVLFLLEHGVAPEAITWIRPRDSWCLNRARIQPGDQFFELAIGGQERQFRAVAESEDVSDMFARLEAADVLLRIDTEVDPTMYRCATVTVRELEAMRTVTNVVRLGRVQSIDASEIVLAEGAIPTTPGTLHVDCTADGLERRPVVQVYDGDTITLQTIRTCQQVFSAAFLAHVELTYDDDTLKNELAAVVPHPNSHLDWMRTTLGNLTNQGRWSQEAELSTWLATVRLNAFGGARSSAPATTPEGAELMQSLEHFGILAAMKLSEYLGNLDAEL